MQMAGFGTAKKIGKTVFLCQSSSSLHAVELASDQFADAWGMRLGSTADVSCFREALAVNLSTSLPVQYEPELNIIHRPYHPGEFEQQPLSHVMTCWSYAVMLSSSAAGLGYTTAAAVLHRYKICLKLYLESLLLYHAVLLV